MKIGKKCKGNKERRKIDKDELKEGRIIEEKRKKVI